MKFSEKPIKVDYGPKNCTINIEGGCNFKCVYCPYHGDYRTSYKKKVRYRLDFDTIKEQIDILKSYGIRHFNICATGEPFLNKDIFKIFSYINGSGNTSSVLSNASNVITKNLEQIIDADLLYFATDLDAASKESFIKIQGKDQFDIWYNNIKKLVELRNKRKSKTKIMIWTIINKDTFDELDKMLDICIELGIDEWHLGALIAGDDVSYVTDERSMKNEREKVASKILDLRKKAQSKNIRMHWPEYFNMDVDIYKDLYCNKPWREAMMINVPLPNDKPGDNIGRVVLGCSGKKSIEYNLGNIHRNTFEEIWNGSEYQRLRSNVLNNCDEECLNDCMYHKFIKKKEL